MKNGKRFLTKYGLRLLLFAGVLAFFLLAGHGGPVLFDDSGSYIEMSWHEGVMPVYPLFLLGNQALFGDAVYLWVVMIEQAVLAAFSVVLLEETLRKQFDLHPVEGVLFCVLALYPYTIEMPGAVMTQAILTEGVAYSLFYIYLVILLQAVWKKSYVRLMGAFGMTLFLSGVRSQLQILFGVCGIVFLYLVCMRRRKKGNIRKLIRLAAGLTGCIVISLTGILLVMGMSRGYHTVLKTDYRLYMIGLKIQHPERYETFLEEIGQEAQTKAGAEESAEAQECPSTEEQTEQTDKEMLAQKNFQTSQYLTLIFSRGMYEADYEDAELFDDPLLKGLYLDLYEAVDVEQERYAYAREGLWMWKDIVGGLGKIGGICFYTPSKYYVEHAIDIIESEQFSEIRAGHLQTIALTLIMAHPGRVLYHTLMLLPQAFVSTVFFQYAPLYLFCHLVTAFLYLLAFALMIWGYADQRARKEGAEMMALILGINVVTVLIISLVFFGQQRYLVYAFGPFYMACYLLLRQLWRVRVREFIKQKFLKRNEEV